MAEPQWRKIDNRPDAKLLAEAQQFAEYLHGPIYGPKHAQAIDAYIQRNRPEP